MDLVRVAEAPAGVTRTTGTALRPNAASCFRSKDLMLLMVASTLHGMVTRESSKTSDWRKRIPPSSIQEYSMGRKPMETPRTSPAFSDCQASSMRSLSRPSSCTSASWAVKVMPLAVGLSNLTVPTGLS
ncbi:hypothetical protein D9M70_520190 [compost metagenome]